MKVTLTICFNQYLLQLWKIKWKSFRKGLGCIIDSVIDHSVNISKYYPLARSSYIKWPKALDHPRKDLANIQSTDDNECFK